MSHLKERTEKICLNCNASIIGKFCHICGQENVEPKESFWQLTTHLIYDIVHFDSKFFSTLKYLLFKPGFLTSEYIRGKRATYLHPIRMYVFTSAIFFIIFFSFIVKPEDMMLDTFPKKEISSSQMNTLKTALDDLKDSVNYITDSSVKVKVLHKIQALQSVTYEFEDSNEKHNIQSEPSKPLNQPKPNDTEIKTYKYGSEESNSSISIFDIPATKREYDSIQATLSANQKDGFIKHSFKMRVISATEKFKYDKKGFFNVLFENFLHSLPTMMFASLPLAALILQLLYLRRKQFLYVQHGVFIIHLYTAMYIIFLIIYGLSALNHVLNWSVLNTLQTLIILTIFFYTYKAMRNFYQQRRRKTVIKYFLLHFIYFIILAALLVVSLLTSLVKI